MPSQYANLNTRDSLELASLASSSNDLEISSDVPSSRPSISSSRKLSLQQDDPLDDGNAALMGARPNRSYSMSSTFDFAANLFPLSSTHGAGGYTPLGASASPSAPGVSGAGASLERHKTLTYMNGLSLIIGLVIGSGIFSSPSRVSEEVGSPGASIVIWVISGILAWTGAASFAELGGAIPLNGGSQVYLAKIIGELAGFLFTWTAVLVLRPASAAIVSIIMGEYLVRAAVGAEVDSLSPWITKSVAFAGLLLVTFVNCLSTKLGVRINDGLMILKFIALIGVTVTGIVVAVTGYSFGGTANLDWKTHQWFENTSSDLGSWAVALYAGLWAYDGWDNTSYVVGEFKNPSRDLPRVIHTAMPLVILCYVLANIAYFLVLPVATINGTNTVAVMFGAQVFGPVGSLVFALVVSASCFGALNSSTFSGSRLVYAAGKEGYIPEVFGNIGTRWSLPSFGASSSSAPSAAVLGGPSSLHPRRGNWLTRRLRALVCDEDTSLFFTPIYSLLLNGTITVVYIVAGEFGTLLTFFGAASYTFYFLAVLGVVILRVREPHLERPYKTWIVTPIVFCCVSLFLVSRAIFAHPLQMLIVVAFVLSGIPVYYWRMRGRNRRPVAAAAVGTEARHNGMMLKSEMDGARPWWKFWKRS